jgi:p24 family protein delta-1
MKPRRSVQSSLLLISLVALNRFGSRRCGRGDAGVGGFLVADAYPMIAHIEEDHARCFRFNVRDHDDAHLIVVALPNEEQYPDKAANWNELEAWYVQQLYEIGQKKSKKVGLATQLADAPEAVARKKSEFLQKNAGAHESSPILVRITDNPGAEAPVYKGKFNAKYFTALTVNHLKRYMRGNQPRPAHEGSAGATSGHEENLEGYGLCFTNLNKEHMTYVVFDVVLDSDVPTDPRMLLDASKAADSAPKTDFDKDKHLTPLERSLDQSIASANAVLREMRYMEKREQRMRQTSDHINQRVRWFSYLSIGVLLVVTYIQIGYLKRYFHKKKLL